MSCLKKEELIVSKCFNTVGVPNFSIAFNLSGAITISLESSTGADFSGVISGSEASATLIGFPAGSVLLGEFTGTFGQSKSTNVHPILTLTLSSLSSVTLANGVVISTSGVYEVVSGSTITFSTSSSSGVISGNFTSVAARVTSYTPILDATTFTNPFKIAFVKIKNNGINVSEAIYTSTILSGTNAPTVLPPLTSLPGTTGGLVNILAPGSSFVMSILNPTLIFSIPIYTGAGGVVGTSSLNIQIDSYFCVNAPIKDKECPERNTKPQFMDACVNSSGECSTSITQSLFASLGNAPQFFVAEICNTGTCAATLNLVTTSSGTIVPIFPSGFSSVVATLLARQCFLLVSSNVSSLQAHCLGGSTSPLLVTSGCQVSANIKTYSTIPDLCSASGSKKMESPLMLTGFGFNEKVKCCSKKKKHSFEKQSQFINF